MIADDMANALQEVSVERLPAMVSDAVDQALTWFEDGHRATEGIKTHRRWHGTDLWMVYMDSIDASAGAIVTRRMTIGAYSDQPDRLAFIPDLVVTRPNGRYILPRHKDEISSSQLSLSLFDLQRQLFTASGSREDVAKRVETNLRKTWEATGDFKPSQATVLVP